MSFLKENLDRRLAARRKASTERARLAREIVSRMKPIFRRNDTRRAYLFGSLANGTSGPDADIDLAVQGVPPSAFFKLYGDLIMESPIPVDLVDLDDCSSSIRDRVMREGEVVYEHR